jgi:hypothetical protein
VLILGEELEEDKEKCRSLDYKEMVDWIMIKV